MARTQKCKNKTLVTLTAAAVLTATLLSFMAPVLPAYASTSNWLSGLNAWEITEQITIGWNLGNTLESVYWEDNPTPAQTATAWGNPEPDKELFEAVKRMGFNTVRIPVTWYQHMNYNESTQTYEIESDWMDYVKKTVDYAYGLDMFVILNVHHEEWINVDSFHENTLNQAKIILEDVWQQISSTFAAYDQHLIFEGMNEPRQTCNSSIEWGNGDTASWAYIDALNEVFIEAVRNQGSSCNAERLLMIPSYHATDNAEALYHLTIPDNAGNIAISVHAYEPYSFTMDTEEAHTYETCNRYGAYIPDILDDVMRSLKHVQDSKGAPIIIGEFGASDFCNTNERILWAKDYMAKADQYGFACVLWDNNVAKEYTTGDCFGIINRSTCEPYENAEKLLAVLTDTSKENTEEEASSDWITLYYSSETTLPAWEHLVFSNTAEYLNGDYYFVVFYEGAFAPRFVLENQYDYSWNIDVDAHADSEEGIAYYHYDDIQSRFSEYQVSRYDMGKMILLSTCDNTEIIGIFAVPYHEN